MEQSGDYQHHRSFSIREGAHYWRVAPYLSHDALQWFICADLQSMALRIAEDSDSLIDTALCQNGHIFDLPQAPDLVITLQVAK
jgi:hypothetical protein